jgi:hypothetical protein
MKKPHVNNRIGMESQNKVRVKCYDVEKKQLISQHESYTEAAIFYGIDNGQVRQCVKLKCKCHKNNINRTITFR